VVSTAGLTDVNTIQATDSLARTIAVGTGNTLRLGASGGVWNTTTGLLTVGVGGAGGTLTAGGATNTPGEIVFNSSSGTGNAITVNSVIANNGTGAVSVVKTGTAILTLNGANTYTGGTYVNRGTIKPTAATALGSGAVTVLPGGSVVLSSGITYANNFNIAGTSPLVLAGATVSGTVTMLGNTIIGNGNISAAGGTISGQITGDYSLAFTGSSASTSPIILSNSANNYTGDTSIGSLPGDQAPSSILNQVLILKLGADNVLPNGVGKGSLVIASNSATYFSSLDLNGKTETINGLISGGPAPGQNRIFNTANATTASLTVGDNDLTATYAGLILYGGSTGTGTGDVAISKVGAGTQTFSGNNTYTGSTTITVGTLVAQADKALGDSSSVLVNGGTLDIRGAATAGTVTLGTNANFSLTSGTINFQLGTSFDQLLSGGTGAFTITGGAFALDVTGAGFSYSTTYAVLSGFGGANSVSGLGFTGYDTGNYTASLGTDGVLSFSAIPEPATWALIAGAGTFLIIMRRRRLVG
jgi:autotransporter-associated beta strand protein